MSLIVEEIDLNTIIYFETDKFNSSNHWKNDIPPQNYKEILSQGNTSNWIDFFHSNYIVINIFENDIKWLREAEKIGNITGRFSKIYEDEKIDFIKRYKFVEKYFDGTKYFIRAENVILKYGVNGIGPYLDFNSIIESLCSIKKQHTPIYENTNKIKLFLLPWLEFEYMNEYRVFVYKNRITAISQQNLYEKNSLFCNLDEVVKNNKINSYFEIIIKYFNEKIKKNITFMDSYTYDFAILPKNIPYLIEFNSFGKEYAAGSSLFHWLVDEEKLYNQEEKIYFRYTI